MGGEIYGHESQAEGIEQGQYRYKLFLYSNHGNKYHFRWSSKPAFFRLNNETRAVYVFGTFTTICQKRYLFPVYLCFFLFLKSQDFFWFSFQTVFGYSRQLRMFHEVFSRLHLLESSKKARLKTVRQQT